MLDARSRGVPISCLDLLKLFDAASRMIASDHCSATSAGV
jgi:hypothetical protein